jgi:hypothetical protein
MRHILTLVACLLVGSRARASDSQIARWCGANDNGPATRTFAVLDERRPWREYPDVKSIPEMEPDVGSGYARIWLAHDGNILVRVAEPGQDFWAYTAYCFDKAGSLIYLGYELRTAWNWGFREEGSFKNGRLNPERPEFFSTETGQPIAKPEQAADVPEALKPQIFPTKAALPFFKLLSQPAGKQKGTS